MSNKIFKIKILILCQKVPLDILKKINISITKSLKINLFCLKKWLILEYFKNFCALLDFKLKVYICIGHLLSELLGPKLKV